jgi:3-methyl-2-oxobutanoate hydroxymethyltransferase
MDNRTKITIPAIIARKGCGPKIVQVTAYDFPTAVIAERAGVDIIVVGDSLAQVVLGYEENLRVSFDEMLHHVKAVMRAQPKAIVVADMPFMSYQISIQQAVSNAGRYLQEGRATAIKLEGGRVNYPTAKAIVDAGIPVMGHVGQVPQSIYHFGGFVVRGESPDVADQICNDALAFEEAGAFAVALEMMPASLSSRITKLLKIPTISSGAGPDCDGQVMIMHDLLGMNYGPVHPSCVKEYSPLGEMAVDSVRRFADEVRNGAYPGLEHSY